MYICKVLHGGNKFANKWRGAAKTIRFQSFYYCQLKEKLAWISLTWSCSDVQTTNFVVFFSNDDFDFGKWYTIRKGILEICPKRSDGKCNVICCRPGWQIEKIINKTFKQSLKVFKLKKTRLILNVHVYKADFSLVETVRIFIGTISNRCGLLTVFF